MISSILYMLRRLNLLGFACRQPGLVFVPIHRRLARVDLLHANAIFDRANQAAQVAANAGVLLDREDIDRVASRARQYLHTAGTNDLGPIAVGSQKHVPGHPVPADRLVGAVLTGDVAQATVDAFMGIDFGDELVVQIQLAPGFNARYRAANEIADRLEAFLAHPAFQAAAQVLDETEAVV